MMTRSRVICLLGSILPLTGTGCIVNLGVSGCSGPTVWTTSTTEKLPIETANLKALEVRTHNGSITFDGQPVGTTEAFVNVTKKAGGLTQADAEEALDAIDVYVEPAGSGAQRIGWKWKGARHATWRAQVSFDIQAPGNLRFDGVTHNGAVKIDDVAGDVKVITHNGRVDVESTDGKLYAETHNGRIAAAYVGEWGRTLHFSPTTAESLPTSTGVRRSTGASRRTTGASK